LARAAGSTAAGAPAWFPPATGRRAPLRRSGRPIQDALLRDRCAAQRIEAFLLTDPDPGSDEDYQRPLRADDIEGFGWKLAHAPAEIQARFIDVNHWRTFLAAAPRAIPALARYGVKRLDRRTLLDERRYVTRTMAGVWRRDATEEGELRAAGLRFTSRLPPAWECWALWEPLALHADRATVEVVTIHTAALRRAADMLGVALALS
jgi:hypothetical protein